VYLYAAHSRKEVGIDFQNLHFVIFPARVIFVYS